MSSRPKVLRAALAAASALSLSMLAACANYAAPAASSAPPAASGSASTSGAAVSLVTPGKLTMCTHLSYKPFEFKDDSGNVVGFDIDLVDLISKKLGVTTEVVDIEFEQITAGTVFTTKKCDLGAAATTITEARQKSTLYSDSYFAATQALLVKADSGITGLDGLRGKLLAVQTGTTGMIYADKNKDANGYTTKEFDDMPKGANAVLGGTVQGAINDNGVLYDFAKDNPTTKVVAEFATDEHYGFNVDTNNTALMTVINEVIASSKTDGTYNTVYKKWFGVDAPN